MLSAPFCLPRLAPARTRENAAGKCGRQGKSV
jgi:hypothetical protein